MQINPILQLIKSAVNNSEKRQLKYPNNEIVLGAIPVSRKAENYQQDELVKLVKYINSQIKQKLLPKLKLYEPYYQKQKPIGDGLLRDVDYVQDIKDAIAEIFVSFQSDKFRELVDRLVREVVTQSATDFNKLFALEVKKAVGVDISPLLGQYYEDIGLATQINSDMIVTIPEQYLNRVQASVLRNMEQGRRYEELAKDLQREYGINANRAKLIARDQTGKLNLAITEAQAKNVGSDEFKFSTSHDERVRATHRAADGKPCKVGDSIYNLRYDVQCRCVLLIIIKWD